MSKAQKAFIDGILWTGNNVGDGDYAEARRLYPDSHPTNVREIVVAYLKDNGYDGLWAASGCYCDLNCIGGGKHCQYVLECRPGVIVAGKIVGRE
jgi:hypothetical protein